MSLPVAVISSNFQEFYLEKAKALELKERAQLVKELKKNQEAAGVLAVSEGLNQIDRENDEIKEGLQDIQFLYRSLERDANEIMEDFLKKMTKNKKNKLFLDQIKEAIYEIRKTSMQKQKILKKMLQKKKSQLSSDEN
jgi:hypothetical protein